MGGFGNDCRGVKFNLDKSKALLINVFYLLNCMLLYSPKNVINKCINQITLICYKIRTAQMIWFGFFSLCGR